MHQYGFGIKICQRNVKNANFLIVRGKETSIDNKINAFKKMTTFVPDRLFEAFDLRSGKTIQTIGEMRVWASFLLVSGSSLVFSDRIKTLNTKGLEIIEKTF
jgi:hypothetical protein